MEIISYYKSDRQEHWLREIGKSDWSAAAFLCELLSKGTFFDTLGESTELLLLNNGDALVSYCTYAERDEIQPTELAPWIGFVYTFPEYRGHRYAGVLFDWIYRLAAEHGVPKIYISTDHIGLYEKYGYEYMTDMKTVWGDISRIYARRVIC